MSSIICKVVNDLSHKLSLETKLKDSLAEEVSALRAEVEGGQRSRERELIEVDEGHEQQLQTIVTEHAQKVSDSTELISNIQSVSFAVF